jgi:hypothetical protein
LQRQPSAERIADDNRPADLQPVKHLAEPQRMFAGGRVGTVLRAVARLPDDIEGENVVLFG